MENTGQYWQNISKSYFQSGRCGTFRCTWIANNVSIFCSSRVFGEVMRFDISIRGASVRLVGNAPTDADNV